MSAPVSSPIPSVPTSTYRLQFHSKFTLRHALELVDYLARLGVSHVYASPILTARAGSTHGYDIVNHNELNPELGTLADFDRFIEALQMFYHVANIGDARSLAIHPATTTHSQLSEADQAATGVTPGYVRLSIGIEHVDDIIADLGQALDAATGSSLKAAAQ